MTEEVRQDKRGWHNEKKYDFSLGERGRFFRPDTTLNIPVYLDQDVEICFSEKAKAKGVKLQDMVNELLRKDISMLQEATGRG